nr:GNAT family acetyltransferase [Sphingomonas dokdonensis]
MRPATIEDEAPVVALWRSCGLIVSHNDPVADFRFAQTGDTSAILLGEQGEVIVGAVMVGHDGHRGWLYYLAAAPDRRGHGVGQSIVEAAERWLAARGVRKVQLMIRPTNIAVARFYDRLGYAEEPRVVTAKWLTPPA